MVHKFPGNFRPATTAQKAVSLNTPQKHGNAFSPRIRCLERSFFRGAFGAAFSHNTRMLCLDFPLGAPSRRPWGPLQAQVGLRVQSVTKVRRDTLGAVQDQQDQQALQALQVLLDLQEQPEPLEPQELKVLPATT